jgi:hypothetical protein
MHPEQKREMAYHAPRTEAGVTLGLSYWVYHAPKAEAGVEVNKVETLNLILTPRFSVLKLSQLRILTSGAKRRRRRKSLWPSFTACIIIATMLSIYI